MSEKLEKSKSRTVVSPTKGVGLNESTLPKFKTPPPPPPKEKKNKE